MGTTPGAVKIGLQRQCGRQNAVIVAAADLDRTKAGQMVGQKLRIKKPIAGDVQPVDQIGQRHLGRIGAVRKHAFAEKRAPQGHTVNAARQVPVGPDLGRMGVALGVKLAAEVLDLGVDPGLGPVGASGDNFAESLIKGDVELFRQNAPSERAGNVKTVKR